MPLLFQCWLHLFSNCLVYNILCMQPLLVIHKVRIREESSFKLFDNLCQRVILVCTCHMTFYVQMWSAVPLVLRGATYCWHASKNTTARSHVVTKFVLASESTFIATRAIRTHSDPQYSSKTQKDLNLVSFDYCQRIPRSGGTPQVILWQINDGFFARMLAAPLRRRATFLASSCYVLVFSFH